MTSYLLRYLGTEDPPWSEKAWYSRIDPINRSRCTSTIFSYLYVVVPYTLQFQAQILLNLVHQVGDA